MFGISEFVSVHTFQHVIPSCTFSILTPILAQSSSVRALTYTTQVRSGGSQVIVGNRNHRAEPVSVLRRAPTLTDEQRQQRVGIRALSSIRALAAEREGETPGKLRARPSSSLASFPPESPTTGFDMLQHGQTVGYANTVFGST